MAKEEFIKAIGEFAKKDMQTSHVLASLTIAQAILESGWGKYTIGDANNLFGYKGQYKGQSVTSPTKEFVNGQYFNTTAEFRKYPSWEESLQDHSELLTRLVRYKAVIGETDYKKACHAIADAGYATSPVYAGSLISLIEQYHLNVYDVMDVKPTVPVKTVDEISREVLAGKWGNGTYRKSSIENAGYDYNAVQQKVNELCGQAPTKPQAAPIKSQCKPLDDIAREVIKGSWGNGAVRKQKLTKAGYNYEDVRKKVNQLI